MSPTLASTSFLSDSLSEVCPALPCSDGMPPLQFQMIGLGWVVFSFLYVWHDHLFCDRNATIDRVSRICWANVDPNVISA